jgi:hypothetical protein
VIIQLFTRFHTDATLKVELPDRSDCSSPKCEWSNIFPNPEKSDSSPDYTKVKKPFRSVPTIMSEFEESRGNLQILESELVDRCEAFYLRVCDNPVIHTFTH